MMYSRHNFDMSGGRGRPASDVSIDNAFGAWLRAKRTARGYTGEALSFRTNGLVSQGSISHYERGTKRPEARSVVLLAEALGVDPAEALAILAADASLATDKDHGTGLERIVDMDVAGGRYDGELQAIREIEQFPDLDEVRRETTASLLRQAQKRMAIGGTGEPKSKPEEK